MRILYTIKIIVFLTVCAFAQDVVVESSCEGDQMVLTATNNENDDYRISVELETKGYGLKRIEKVESVVPGGESIEIGRYKVKRKKSASFSYKYAFQKMRSNSNSQSPKTMGAQTGAKEEDAKMEVSEIVESDLEGSELEEGLIVFSKNRCGRCARTVEFLRSNHIPFTDKNISDNPEDKEQMTKLMFSNGFEGGRFTTPVIVVDGKVHYNIKNLGRFLSGLQ